MKKSLGIYIHIPYCVKKCRYCDFLSFPCSGSNEDEIGSYVDACVRQMNSFKRGSDEYAVDTIFIGGGTPTVIDERHIGRILAELRNIFDVTEDAEITIEANPGTLTIDKLKAYKNAGINRLSMGVQSLNDDILKGLGRIHTAYDAESSFKVARDAGFDNISIDLMFAVPGLTMDIWKSTLSQAVYLEPEHISFYSLQIEEGTEFGRLFEEGKLSETDAELDRAMYHYAIDFLKEHGYMQYEISNAAKEGFHSRHNMRYWEMKEYLGVGLGASSYLRPYASMDGDALLGAGYSYRAVNTESLEDYIAHCGDEKTILGGAVSVAGCMEDIHENTFFDDASEFVFTGLRKSSGISFNDFHVFTGKHFFEVYGDDIKKKISSWEREGYCKIERVSDNYGDERDLNFLLTPEGFDISNSILMEFV